MEWPCGQKHLQKDAEMKRFSVKNKKIKQPVRPEVSSLGVTELLQSSPLLPSAG